MNEVWMLDYIYAVFPQWGVFESEEAAWAWVDEHDPHSDRTAYKPFSITINRNNEGTVPTTCPEKRYVNQR